jgi:glyoxylase-like metal-dependent hydrolase (beta-lactamase superfamily II)
MRDHGQAVPDDQRTDVSTETGTSTADWAEPGAHPVAPGVYRVPLPLPTDGLRAVNVYVLQAGDSLVLIDGGWALAESRAALSAALAGLGCGLGDIRHFLVTHVHRDHYTQAVELRREFGSKVSLGAGEQAAIQVLLAGGSRPLEPQVRQLRASGAEAVLQRLRASGAIPPGRPPGWEAPDEWLAPQQEIELDGRTLRVVPTPGHTQGHVVFTDTSSGLLFAGDHVLPHITPSIGFEPVMARLPLGDYLESLRLVRAMPDLRLLPAHGPVTASTHARVDELLRHHDGRLAECADAVAAGAATAYQVARVLRWTRRERHLDALDPFNQMLAVTETRAHLELLVAQGRLTVSWADGVACYASLPR